MAPTEAQAPRQTTRAWAEAIGYEPAALLQKLFHDDMLTLLSMDKLWRERRPPVPITASTEFPPEALAHAAPTSAAVLADQRVWTAAECRDAFSRSVRLLSAALAQTGPLSWDKDDADALDFVVAASNLRSFSFGIPLKSRFDVKAMAGNIIPAIAGTNAIVAGLIVLEAFKILRNPDLIGRDCRAVFLARAGPGRARLLNSMQLPTPNPECLVCAPRAEAVVTVNTATFTVGQLVDRVLKGVLGMKVRAGGDGGSGRYTHMK